MIRTDDNAPLHSKFQQAGILAYGWWHAALSYCGRQLTDGFIAARDLPLVFPTASPAQVATALEALVREGCLHKVEAGQSSPCGRRRSTCPTMSVPVSGVILHDYFDYQERAKSARLRRRNLSTYGRKGGKKSAEMRQASASSRRQAEALPQSVPIRSVPPASRRSRNGDTADVEEFVAQLRPLYSGVDVDQEANKLRAWLLTPRGRGKTFTRQRFVAWLNRCSPAEKADDPYADWPHLWDCECGEAHEGRGQDRPPCPNNGKRP